MGIRVRLGGARAKLDPESYLFLDDCASDLIVNLVQPAPDQVRFRGEDGHTCMREGHGRFFPRGSDVFVGV